MKLFHLPKSTKTMGFKNISGMAAAKEMKVPLLDSGGLFKDYELHKVNPVRNRGYGCDIS